MRPPRQRGSELTETRRHRRWLRIKIWFRKERYQIRQHPRWNHAYRAGVGAVGTLMILCGAVMVPLPTPGFGWILIFLGLGVMSTEFAWAKKLTHWVRRGYDWVRHWFGRRSMAERVSMVSAVVVLVLGVLWLSGMMGTAASWAGVEHRWLSGPIRGH